MKSFTNSNWFTMAALGPEKLFERLRREAFWRGLIMGIFIGFCLCYIIMEVK